MTILILNIPDSLATLLMGDIRQWGSEWVLVVRGALLVLLLSLLRLGFSLDLWGCTEAVFCPGPSVGVDALITSIVVDTSRYAPGA